MSLNELGKRIGGLFVMAVTLGALSVRSVDAWTVPTHRFLSLQAAESSVLATGVLRNLGFQDLSERLGGVDFDGVVRTYEISRWITDGASFEDDGWPTARYLNHFHNPLSPWSDAGLDDVGVGSSSLLWAHSAGINDNPDWHWGAVRLSYYRAFTLPTKFERDQQFARVFAGLGHLVHLIQDLAQPAHVRNDNHFFEGAGVLNGMESWAESQHDDGVRGNDNDVVDFAESAVRPSVPLTTVRQVNSHPIGPISEFWDSDVYDGSHGTLFHASSLGAGLAEYTNANFFSEDTIGSLLWYHQFPFPSLDLSDYHICEDAAPRGSLAAKRRYVSRTACVADPQQGRGDHFLALTLLRNVPGYDPPRITLADLIDDNVREDYARELIPRAVGYSSALIDYFFRSDIEVSVPKGGAYAVTTDTAPLTGAFRTLYLNARSVLTTGASLSNGTIELVVSYRTSQADPFQGQIVSTSQEVTQSVFPVANNVRAIPSDEAVELVFDLTNRPIPLLATDLRIQIVYKGEAIAPNGIVMPDTVAVGYYDLSEPTPITVINNTDHICIRGSYAVAGSPDAIAAVDSNQNGLADEADVFAHGIQDLYIRLGPVDAPQPASPAGMDHQAMFTEINPAEFGRFFVLTDYRYSLSLMWSAVSVDDRDDYGHFTLPHTVPSIPAVRNQFDVINGTEVREVSPGVPVRGVHTWYYVPFENRPVDSDFCDVTQVVGAQPNLTGPVNATVP